MFHAPNQKIAQQEFCLKWERFSELVFDFFSNAPITVIEELNQKPDYVSYFLRCDGLYTKNQLVYQLGIPAAKVIERSWVMENYLEDIDDFLLLIDSVGETYVPSFLQDEKWIKEISETVDEDSFYRRLSILAKKTGILPYLEAHNHFIDAEISQTKDKVLPSFRKEDPKLAQEHSKQVLQEMIVSRLFETEPYNLLIDIETLLRFAQEQHRELVGQEIYEFLVHLDSPLVSTSQLIDFYNKWKNAPLKEILYDDWNQQKEELIEEVNQNVLKLESVTPTKTANGWIYDISDRKEPLIVHNTSIGMRDKKSISFLLEEIENAEKKYLSVSIQDENHPWFFGIERAYGGSETIKLIYDHLDSNRVGMIFHKDAYSTGINQSDAYANGEVRRLYTLKTLMAQTIYFNEITYAIDSVPFYPIGFLCENGLKKEVFQASKQLHLPIFYRKKKEKNIEVEFFEAKQKKYRNYNQFQI